MSGTWSNCGGLKAVSSRRPRRAVVTMSMEAGVGVMGTKLGMMSYFQSDGEVVPVTVVGFKEANKPATATAQSRRLVLSPCAIFRSLSSMKSSRMGGTKRKIRKLKIVKIDKDLNVVMIKGAVPGKPGNLLWITPAKIVDKNIPKNYYVCN